MTAMMMMVADGGDGGDGSRQIDGKERSALVATTMVMMANSGKESKATAKDILMAMQSVIDYKKDQKE